MLGTFKAIIRFSVRPVSDWIWRRFEARVRSVVEACFHSLEERSDVLEVRTRNLQGRIAELQTRIDLLEKEWEKHVPTFLRATSTVVSFERELRKLRDAVFTFEKDKGVGRQ